MSLHFPQQLRSSYGNDLYNPNYSPPTPHRTLLILWNDSTTCVRTESSVMRMINLWDFMQQVGTWEEIKVWNKEKSNQSPGEAPTPVPWVKPVLGDYLVWLVRIVNSNYPKPNQNWIQNQNWVSNRIWFWNQSWNLDSILELEPEFLKNFFEGK